MIYYMETSGNSKKGGSPGHKTTSTTAKKEVCRLHLSTVLFYIQTIIHFIYKALHNNSL
jgi:hypothetical protein